MAQARRGRSGALLILGEPGIGKTALLEYAEHAASEWTRLRATGGASEAELPFAGLSQLLAPVIDQLPELPAPQAAALSGALALGPAWSGDAFTIYAGVLSLISAAAEQRPVLVSIEDAQWVDQSSQNALLFAIRRLHAERIAVVIAARMGAEHTFLSERLPKVVLAGLDATAGRDLVRRSANSPIADAVADRLVAATGGNPLALLHVPRQLSAAQLAGAEPLPDPLPVEVDLRALFLARLRQLPPNTRRALVVASAAEPVPLLLLTAALDRLGLGLAALETAEADGIIRVTQEHVTFAHPLVRASVYHAAAPTERRQAHRLLADQLVDPKSQGLRAWHLAAAALGPDEAVASELEQAALTAAERGAHAVAGETLERAAGLSPSPAEKARRLTGAATELHIAGHGQRALAVLDRIDADASPASSAQAQHIRGLILLWHGPVGGGVDHLVSAARAAVSQDSEKALDMLIDATTGCFMAGDVGRAVRLAREAYDLSRAQTGPGRVRAAISLSGALLSDGQYQESKELLASWRGVLAEQRSPVELLQLAGGAPLAAVVTWHGEYRLARDFLNQAIDFGRASSSPGILPVYLALRSDIALRTGEWHVAVADADESVRLAHETGQAAMLLFGMVLLARAQALTGRAGARDQAAKAMALSRETGGGSIPVYAAAALGLEALGAGRFHEAADDLMQAWRHMQRTGMQSPTPVPFVGDLIEALLRAGRADDAEAITRWLDERARDSPLSWTVAIAARCRGMLADADFESHFRRALDWHERLTDPYERARTQLAFGERLRRGGQRARAREQLRAALSAFDRLGAAPWSAQAAQALRATGERLEQRAVGGVGQLTPQELQVALTVAAGATNRETAAALFLSPKTIEFHLTRVYAKLEVRSRVELARVLAAQQMIQN